MLVSGQSRQVNLFKKVTYPAVREREKKFESTTKTDCWVPSNNYKNFFGTEGTLSICGVHDSDCFEKTPNEFRICKTNTLVWSLNGPGER